MGMARRRVICSCVMGIWVLIFLTANFANFTKLAQVDWGRITRIGGGSRSIGGGLLELGAGPVDGVDGVDGDGAELLEGYSIHNLCL